MKQNAPMALLTAGIGKVNTLLQLGTTLELQPPQALRAILVSHPPARSPLHLHISVPFPTALTSFPHGLSSAFLPQAPPFSTIFASPCSAGPFTFDSVAHLSPSVTSTQVATSSTVETAFAFSARAHSIPSLLSNCHFLNHLYQRSVACATQTLLLDNARPPRSLPLAQ